MLKKWKKKVFLKTVCIMLGVRNARKDHAKYIRGLEHPPYNFLQTNFPVNHLISGNLKDMFSLMLFKRKKKNVVFQFTRPCVPKPRRVKLFSGCCLSENSPSFHDP